ncbi:hypothetical protein D3C85_1851320 [compost metagenome]
MGRAPGFGRFQHADGGLDVGQSRLAGRTVAARVGGDFVTKQAEQIEGRACNMGATQIAVRELGYEATVWSR